MGASNESFSLDNPHTFAGGSIKRRTRVFMTPHEIVSTFRFGDMPGSKEEQVSKGSAVGGQDWAQGEILAGSQNGLGAASDGYSSLEESMKAKGFDTSKPVVLNPTHSLGPTIMDGHHRIIMANHLAPLTPIPVMFTHDEMYNRTIESSGSSRKRQPVKPNYIDANCKACGQRVLAGEGSMVKVKNGPWHVYHPEHLTPVMHSMYRANPPKAK